MVEGASRGKKKRSDDNSRINIFPKGVSIEWKRGQFTWNTTYDDVIAWNGSSQTLQLPRRRHLHGRPTSQIRMITITFVFLEKKLAGRINSFNAIQSLHTDLKSIPKLISIQEKKQEKIDLSCSTLEVSIFKWLTAFYWSNRALIWHLDDHERAQQGRKSIRYQFCWIAACTRETWQSSEAPKSASHDETNGAIVWQHTSING